MSIKKGEKILASDFNAIISNINACTKYGYGNPNIASVVKGTPILASQFNAVVSAINSRSKIIAYKNASFSNVEKGSLIKAEFAQKLEQVGLDVKNNMVCAGCKNICSSGCTGTCLNACKTVCNSACST
ncbi:hypothetical protein, partial [uncultured Pediococcus sp.]|uniref:hypothetical protein n=1 Tax=uncultured Pediococcus sp. TaxID=165192 RepID=UPI00259B3900